MCVRGGGLEKEGIIGGSVDKVIALLLYLHMRNVVGGDGVGGREVKGRLHVCGGRMGG